MSRDGSLLMYVILRGYELSEHISTIVEVNPMMLSTFKSDNTFEA